MLQKGHELLDVDGTGTADDTFLLGIGALGGVTSAGLFLLERSSGTSLLLDKSSGSMSAAGAALRCERFAWWTTEEDGVRW